VTDTQKRVNITQMATLPSCIKSAPSLESVPPWLENDIIQTFISNNRSVCL